MHKHLQNLQRLFQKMQARYGENDELVIQLKQELIAFEAKMAKDTAAVNKGRRHRDLTPQSLAIH
jgi:succinyl-CoA synthetase beta subunit